MKKVYEVSKIAGISRRTLQYYDEQGVLPVMRSEEGYRLYSEDDLERMWEILIYKEMKLELEEIRSLMDSSEEEKEQYLKKHICQEEQKIREHEDVIALTTYVLREGIPDLKEEQQISETYVERIARLKEIWIDREGDIEEKSQNKQIDPPGKGL